MKFWECLPSEVGQQLREVRGLREVRLRDGKPVKVNIGGKWFWSGAQKLLTSPVGAVCFDSICEEFVKKACNGSVYAYEKMLAQGFFTLEDGCRVGVCGIMGGNEIFKKYTSLCIRIAKNVSCAQIFNKSTVVAGPPRSGKTTYLRDMANKLSVDQNVIVVDERGEISCCDGFEKGFCDVFLYASKQYAFQTAVRAMSPDWIVCDELASDEILLLKHAEACGVKVAASIHAENFDDVKAILGDALSTFGYVVLLQKDTFRQIVRSVEDFRQTSPKTVLFFEGT